MNKIDLNGRCAVVTGGAQGFGRAITERFVASGAKVAIWDHDLPFAEKTAKEIGPAVIAFKVDVSDLAAVEKTPRRDAEGVRQDRHPRQQCRHRRHQQDGVGNRPRRMAQGAAHQSRRPLHLLQGGGAGDARSRNTAASSTSPRSPARKAIPTPRIIRPRRPALIALTKSLGKELAQHDILVNAVTPAAAKTAIFDQMTQQHIDFMLSKIPKGRFVLVEELAAMVAWLASEDCAFSTGAVFDISGGRATY